MGFFKNRKRKKIVEDYLVSIQALVESSMMLQGYEHNGKLSSMGGWELIPSDQGGKFILAGTEPIFIELVANTFLSPLQWETNAQAIFPNNDNQKSCPDGSGRYWTVCKSPVFDEQWNVVDQEAISVTTSMAAERARKISEIENQLV